MVHISIRKGQRVKVGTGKNAYEAKFLRQGANPIMVIVEPLTGPWRDFEEMKVGSSNIRPI